MCIYCIFVLLISIITLKRIGYEKANKSNFGYSFKGDKG